MGRPELAEDARFRSERQWVVNRDEIHELVGEWTASHPTAGLVERMNEAGVPCSRIYSIADIFEAPPVASVWFEATGQGDERMRQANERGEWLGDASVEFPVLILLIAASAVPVVEFGMTAAAGLAAYRPGIERLIWD